MPSAAAPTAGRPLGSARPDPPSREDPPPGQVTAADGGTTDRRERRRRRTREHIAAVGLRLVEERGYDRVTVDDIAAAADIAPRTFFRYFTCKEDLFFVDHAQRIDRLRRALGDRPVDEPVLSSLREGIVALVRDLELDRERAVVKARVIDRTPALRARSLDRQDGWRQVVAATVGERLGVDPEDLRCQVLATATLGALQAAVRRWASDPSGADLVDIVDEAFDVLGHLGGDRPGSGDR